MEPIRLDDVLGRERYGLERDAIRRRVIAHKRSRRVAVGDLLTLVFEDRATVWYQTQEMLWVEHIIDLDAVRTELAVYNQMLPGADELSATLFVEVRDQAHIAEELQRLLGIDEHLLLGVEGMAPVRAQFEPGRQTAEKLSAVQYVRFKLPGAMRARIAAGAAITVSTDHPRYAVSVVLGEAVRTSLAADLAGAAGADGALKQVRDAD
jgi:uncharacterized protein DUF3501